MNEIFLKCSAKQKIITPCPVAFGEVGAKQRIKNILNYKRPALWVIIISIIICVFVAFSFLTDPIHNNSIKNESKKVDVNKYDNSIFWEDGNVFEAELTGPVDESFVTKKCVGLIKEESEGKFSITIKCDYLKNYDYSYLKNKDYLYLGTYIVKENQIIKKVEDDNIVIWSNKAIKDKNKSDKGIHSYVKIEKDTIFSRYSNQTVETGYYEQNDFSKDKTLLKFESGFGAQRDLIKIEGIHLIKDSQNKKEQSCEIKIEDKFIRKVLKNEDKFYNIQLKKQQFLKDYKYDDFMICDETGKYSYEDNAMLYDENFSFDYIAQVDMDGDGNKEVVLSKAGTGTRFMLHTYKNQVYLYSFPFRQMKTIAQDGQFDGSSSAADAYVGRLKFDGVDCYYKQICLVDELEDDHKVYILNGKNVKKKKAVNYLCNFAKYQPEWYEYDKVLMQ